MQSRLYILCSNILKSPCWQWKNIFNLCPSFLNKSLCACLLDCYNMIKQLKTLKLLYFIPGSTMIDDSLFNLLCKIQEILFPPLQSYPCFQLYSLLHGLKIPMLQLSLLFINQPKLFSFCHSFDRFAVGFLAVNVGNLLANYCTFLIIMHTVITTH